MQNPTEDLLFDKHLESLGYSREAGISVRPDLNILVWHREALGPDSAIALQLSPAQAVNLGLELIRVAQAAMQAIEEFQRSAPEATRN